MAGESFDGVDRGPVAESLRDRRGQFGLRECRAVCGEVTTEQVGDPFIGGDGALPGVNPTVVVEANRFQSPHVIDVGGVAAHRGNDEALCVRRPPTEGLGFELPDGVEAFGFTFRLVASSGEHGGVTAWNRVGRAGRFQPRFDLLGALGECVDDVLGDAGDLGDVAAGSPLDAESAAEFVAVDGLEYLAGGTGVLVDLGVNE